MSNYKYTIDQKALTSFFVDKEPTKAAIKAAKMVITAVIIKHFAKFLSREEDLTSLCMVKLLTIRSQYDLSYSAYNFAYTACRNEIGNYLNKQKEIVVEDILPMSNASVDPTIASLPCEINKFKPFLTGEKGFTVIELTEREAVNIVLFCEKYHPSRKIEPPEFIAKDPRAVQILYRLLLKL